MSTVDSDGMSELHLTCDTDRIEKLCADGADIHLVDGYEQTPLQRACGFGMVRVAVALLRCGATFERRPMAQAYEIECFDAAVAQLGGPDGVRATHRAWLEALDDTSVAKQRWLAAQPGRYTKAAR
jgi:hypothetical protein